MTKHTITLIPGDGIGPETSTAMQKVVEATGVDIEWEIAPAGEACIETHGTPLPESTLEAVRRNKVAIKGPLTTPVGTGFRSINVALRKTLDLYVCLRPVLSLPGAGGRFDNVDIVIVRENSEDLYAGVEFEEGSQGAADLIKLCADHEAGIIRPDSGISVKPISMTGSERIVRWAFDYAVRQQRSKVTAVHKANIMKYTDGLFLHTAQDVAARYEGKVEFDDRIIDAFCMNLIIDPTQFDVIVFPNLYGDIASDLAAGMVGGLGIAPGANIGDECAIFEPVHGSAPKHAGKDEANPTAEILSAAMMLDHIGEFDAAAKVRAAIAAVYEAGDKVTYDIRRANGSDKPAAACSEFADELVRVIGAL